MNLIGKTVNISNKSLLEVFYPNFLVKDKLFFDNDNSIIYIGKPQKNLMGFLENNTKEFINTIGVCDVDFDIKENLIKFVYDKFNKIPKEKVIEILSNFPNIDFYNFIKSYWVSGISYIDDESNVSIYDLFIAMSNSKAESLKVINKLLEIYPIGVLQNSVETFLEKVISFPEVSGNYRYFNLLKKFKENNINKLKKILYDYYVMKDSKEFKLKWLLYQF